MACEIAIAQLEKLAKRKLTPAEKKRVQDIMHHTEISGEKHKHEEELIAC